MKRPIVLFSVYFAAGIGMSHWMNKWLVLSCLICFILLNLFYRNKKARVQIAIVSAAAFIFGVNIGYLHLQDMERSYELINDAYGTEVRLQGRITGKSKKNGEYKIRLSECLLLLNGKTFELEDMLTSIDGDEYMLGETVCLSGKFVSFERASNDGCYDEKAYYGSMSVVSEFAVSNILARDGKGNSLKEFLYGLKEKLIYVYENSLPDKFSGLLEAMVTGDRGDLDADEKELYSDTGMGHLIAVSGLHISMLCMGLFGLLRKKGMNYAVCCPIAAVFSLIYLDFVGMQVSAARAVFMFILLMISCLIGRAYDGYTAIGLASVLALLSNPMYLCNSAFQMSFLAATAACLSMEIIKSQSLLSKNKLLGSLLFGICIQLFTLPVMANCYHTVHTSSLALNLFILPTAGFLLVTGLAGGAFGILNLRLGRILLLPDNILLLFYHQLCRAGKAFSWNELVIGDMKDWEIFLYYLCLGLIYFNLVYGRHVNISLKPLTKSRYRWGGTAVLLFIACFISFRTKVSGFEADILDVGQGDGAYIHTASGYNIFIDGGSTSKKDIGTYVIKPFLYSKGVKSIDYWFISHTDEDHISGLRELEEAGFKIKHILLPVTEKGNADDLKGDVLYLKQGDSIDLVGARFYVLSPESGKSQNEEADSDKNENCMVLLYEENGFSGLLTGDMGIAEEDIVEEQLESLKTKEDYDGKLEWYKCAHHGSRYSNSYDFLEYLKPDFTTISCARYNNYGHPAPSVIENFKEVGTKIYYTMYGGRICVDSEGVTTLK